ncbi:MAG: hypothetical protein JW997_02585 [Actinobacteria bacterium]|nr:hypothetical protein [Actinomycetota bacterium]
MSRKLLIMLSILSALCWFLLLFSLSLFMFYWRIVNEPGAGSAVKILIAACLLIASGFAGTVAVNAIFIKFKEKRAWIAWAANLGATVIYLPAFVLTLLMMV